MRREKPRESANDAVVKTTAVPGMSLCIKGRGVTLIRKREVLDLAQSLGNGVHALTLDQTDTLEQRHTSRCSRGSMSEGYVAKSPAIACPEQTHHHRCTTEAAAMHSSNTKHGETPRLDLRPRIRTHRTHNGNRYKYRNGRPFPWPFSRRGAVQQSESSCVGMP